MNAPRISACPRAMPCNKWEGFESLGLWERYRRKHKLGKDSTEGIDHDKNEETSYRRLARSVRKRVLETWDRR